MTDTQGKVIADLTEEYLDTLDMANLPPPHVISRELLKATNARIDLENAVLPKDEKWRKLRQLSPDQLASVLLRLHHVTRIQCAGPDSDPDTDMLGAYITSGPDEGTYASDETSFFQIMHGYEPGLSSKTAQEAYWVLMFRAPTRPRTDDPDLVPVNNGVFNFRTKTLSPFTPDYIFLTKSKVDYVDNPANPVIRNPDDGTDWDVETWMETLSDDPEIVQVLWEVMGAVVRPFVPWNKSAWFYSESGNSGKGTLCALMRNLCGPGAWCNIPISAFAKDFALFPLTHTTAVITDENDVGAYIDKAANLKAVVTGDAIQLDRKYKNPISFQFKGFMVQCVNDMPRIRDRSDSFYRRQLFIPFDKCFTGAERTYIKSDYLARPEVLQYVLWRVLHMDYYALSEPASCKDILDDYKTFNDPLRDFLDEVLPLCQWQLVPFTFLYSLYKAWFQANSPAGSIQSRNTFIRDVSALVHTMGTFPDWSVSKTTVIRSANKMDCYEPLITKYNLTDWMNPKYTGPDDAKRADFPRAVGYRGLLRIGAPAGSVPANQDDGDDDG